MTNKQKLKFNMKKNYYETFYSLFLPEIDQEEKQEFNIQKFDRNYPSLTREALSFLNEINKDKAFTFDKKRPDEISDQILNTLPALSLSKSIELEEFLNTMQASDKLKKHFIDKAELDSAINELSTELDLHQDLHDIFRINCYFIAIEKCRYFVEKSLGILHVSPNGRTVNKSKDKGEKIFRKYKDGSLIKNPTAGEQKFLDSNFGKTVFDSANILVSKNKTGSFNVGFLAHLTFYTLLNAAKDISDTRLMYDIYKVFKVLYTEKGFPKNEDDYYAAKKPFSGTKYDDYKIIQVKSIIYYDGHEKFLAKSERYENKENIDINAFFRSLLNG